MLVLLYAVVSSWRSGPIASANPWGAKTLEWTVPNPIPLANFEVLPVVISDPYGFGEGDVPLFVPLPAEHVDDPAVVGAGSGKDPILTGPDAPRITEREQP
jgi:cytochrome c oxidase subunit 1